MLVLVTALVSFGAGVAVLWANPRRFPNQVFAVLSVLATLFLWCIYQGAAGESPLLQDRAMSRFPWHRGNAAVAAFFPWIIWLLKESVVAVDGGQWRTVRRSWPWLGLGGLLVALGYTDSFIYLDPHSGVWERGAPYVAYNIIGCVAFLFITLQACFQLRGQTGLRRIELKFLVLNAGVTIAVLFVLTSLGNLLHFLPFKAFIFFGLIGSLAVATWAMTTHRVFDAQQVFLALAQRIVLALTFSLVVFGLWRLDERLEERPAVPLLISIAFCGSVAFWLDRKSREWLDLGGERILAGTRRVVIELARTEFHPDELIGCFETLLREQCQTAFAALLFARGDTYAASRFAWAKTRPGLAALYETGWATPESLQRRRSAPAPADLQRFLAEHSLGLIVAVPHGSQNPSLLLALGTKTNQWPFTYPEVQRLQNIAELMDNILTHSRLSLQAAQQARMEQLALMSRGLAHDLKNLITPISSFLIHTDDRFPADSPAAEVHAAARRSVRIMTDYVRETLLFSERLAPKYARVELEGIFREVRGLTAARAARRGVALAATLDYAGPVTADAVLLQRLLANLVGNAVDASAPGQTVTLSAVGGASGWVRLEVVDHGCGIAPENFGRIFDPYFTTKEFGDDVRGFGLGLTICKKIVHLHGGTIGVASEFRRGTTFTIDLPATGPSARPADTGAP